MNVELTADQKAFADEAIKAGRLHTEAKAVEQALQLWEARERTRIELLSAIDTADASVDAGQGRLMDEDSTRELLHQIKHRGRTRLQTLRSGNR